MGAAHWIIGAVVVGGGLFVLHNAGAEEAHAHKSDGHKKGGHGKGAAPGAAAPTSPPAATHVARTSPFPVGTHVEAQDQDGQWYGATVNMLDLANPDAVRWDAGTPGALRNPRSGTSSAAAVRASTSTGKTPVPGAPLGPLATAATPIKEALAAVAAGNPGSLPAALEGVQRGLSSSLPAKL